MTPHLIIILSLSASTVGFAVLADWFRREAVRSLDRVQEAMEAAEEWRDLADQESAEAEIAMKMYVARINAALACLTPHSAFVGQKMARKLRGEA